MSTSPIGPRMCPELFAKMGFVIDGGKVNGMIGGPGDKWYINFTMSRDFGHAVIKAGEGQYM